MINIQFIIRAYLIRAMRFVQAFSKSGRSATEKVSASGRSVTATASAGKINTMEELCQRVLESDGHIFGKELIERYNDPPSKTILLVSHDLSLSGAPIALLSFAKVLVDMDMQVLIMAPEDGDLTNNAESRNHGGLTNNAESRNHGDLTNNAVEKGIPVVTIPRDREPDIVYDAKELFPLIIVNTAAGAPIVRRLCHTDTKVLWWIHEAKKYYRNRAAEEMPRRVTSNIHVYCVGDYANKALKDRFPLYSTDQLIYLAEDLGKIRQIEGTKDTGAEDSSANETTSTKEASANETSANETTSTKEASANETRNRKAIKYALIGRIEDRKGQDIFVQAIDLLPQEILENSRFIFVGAVLQEDIKEQITASTNKHNEIVFYHDEMAVDDMQAFYREIDFLVCASRDDPMPLVVAEAMSLGKPCICSTGSGSATVIKQYVAGLIYDNNDPGKLADLITRANQLSEAEYLTMAESARQAYEDNYSKDVFEKNVSRIMAESQRW